jgi:uncharacterized protein
MEPLKIIQKYYQVDSKSYKILVKHSQAVTKKALEIAKKVSCLKPDLKFIEESTMLHDIGIFLTYAPKIGCFGKNPYVCHGYLGRELLEKEGFPKHALICERHVGVGYSIEDIEEQNLPIPKRDTNPILIEEKIVCFADKFFSKKTKFLFKEKSVDDIRVDLLEFGNGKVEIFDEWIREFE